MKFGTPLHLWALLLVPALVALFWWAHGVRRRKLHEFLAPLLAARLTPSVSTQRRIVKEGMITAALAIVLLAAARPQWGYTWEKLERRGIELVIVLDTSRSMAVADVTPNRLWVAQSLVRRIAAALPGHRVALVQAEGTGVVLAPLTTDTAVLDLPLDGLEAGPAPVPGTRLEPALERALALYLEGGHQHRALVVLSDGEVHGEALGAVARKLEETGVAVHAVAVGTATGGPVPVGDPSAGFKRDRAGRVVVSRREEGSLAALVKATGGALVEVENANADPGPIGLRLRRMETRALGEQQVTTLGERFQWPLGLAAALLALSVALSPFAGSGTRPPP